ncbi:hypothetical protein V6N13_034146 [Hibiscus sabdariffa]
MDDTVADHKLCGYLCTVLTFPLQSIASAAPFSSPCHITTDDDNAVCFQCQNGLLLSAIRNAAVSDRGNAGNSRKKGGKKIGMVHGSISVLNQIHALVAHKCLKIQARLLRVENGVEEARAVVLVDVYLPVDLWAGWQFPRSGSVAGSLFRHLRCDWKERNLMLTNGTEIGQYVHGNVRSIWSVFDCHVLGCKLHCNDIDPLKKRLFELHDIFKSLPSVTNKGMTYSSRIQPSDDCQNSGIWDATDDILMNILAALGPRDLTRVAATCRHLRSLAALIMPCMKLKLFPHQHAAVEWMLKRERNAEVLRHPLFMEFSTEDGFSFHVNSVTGSIVTGTAPTIRDFHGGMFCDEPGLGKTITALSLILKTQGTMADPPEGVQIIWCTHNGNDKCGYYELRGDEFTRNMSLGKRTTSLNVLRRQSSLAKFCLMEDINHPLSKRARLMNPGERSAEFDDSCSSRRIKSPSAPVSEPITWAVRSSRNLGHIRKNLLYAYGGLSSSCNVKTVEKNTPKRNGSRHVYREKQVDLSFGVLDGFRRPGKGTADSAVCTENWVQCDACHKWRKLVGSSLTDAKVAWFCSMNTDLARQSCTDPEEAWDTHGSITYLPGFFTKGTAEGKEENVSFFITVLKEHYAVINSKTKKALLWLSKLSTERLSEMETDGLSSPILGSGVAGDALGFHKIFQAFGLVKRVEKGISRWYYPKTLENLAFDVAALRLALCEPLDSVRLYLSRATLVVVPANLVDHWKTQIQKHVTPGTPTPNTPNSQLSHLQPLLKFLHEEAYGQNQKSWEAGILRPFEAKMEEGRSRLLQLLHRCMISARKIDLQNIPPCIKKVTFVNFTDEHARSYNELVVTVRRNILMADWNDPSHVESLLNPKQWKFRSTTIRNVRLSCCVAGHIKVTEAGEDIQETMDILVENGLDPLSEDYALIKYNLLYGGNCQRCNEWCRLPIVTPCRHLLCLDCVGLDSEMCTLPGCGHLYEMQTPETLARPENPNPKWPVPKDLIELQPSYKQDDWNPDWQSTSSSKVSYLVERLKALQEVNKEIHCSVDEDDEVKNIDKLLWPSQRCAMGVPLLLNCSSPGNGSYKTLPEKVLIFSQFLEHIHVIEQQLTFAGIKFVGMYSPMHSSNKMKSLATFQYDDSCMALLMDGSAALGLDLSFVTHVFLMEPIWDRSMEEQVISRAHRMGATRPIHVETLAMHGTIEEQMMEFLQDADACRKILKEESQRLGHDEILCPEGWYRRRVGWHHFDA